MSFITIIIKQSENKILLHKILYQFPIIYGKNMALVIHGKLLKEWIQITFYSCFHQNHYQIKYSTIMPS